MKFILRTLQYGEYEDLTAFDTLEDLKREIDLIQTVFTTFEIQSISVSGGMDEEIPLEVFEEIERLLGG